MSPRVWFAMGTALLTVLFVAGVLLYGASRVSSNPPSISRPAVGMTVASALRQDLHRQSLVYQWVVCVHMNRYYLGHRLSRCNVNFGEPHIVPYCALLLHGTLVTDRQNRAVDCGKRVRAEEADASVNVR